MPIIIPETHRDLMDGMTNAVLTTVMPDGQPQSTPVWFNYDNDFFLINTMIGFRKEKNMRLNPKVTLLMYDPKNPAHCMEIRGQVAEMTETDALPHLDQLTQKYMGKPDVHFFGDSVSADLAEKHVPVKVKITPVHIRVEG